MSEWMRDKTWRSFANLGDRYESFYALLKTQDRCKPYQLSDAVVGVLNVTSYSAGLHAVVRGNDGGQVIAVRWIS